MKSTYIIALIAVVAVIAVGVFVFMNNDDSGDDSDTHTVVDMQGNTVEVPNHIERVVITSQTPMVPVYIYYENGVDKLAGANAGGLTYAKKGVMGKIYNLNDIPTNFVSGSTVNEEELLKLNPDVVIYTGNRTDEHEMLEKDEIVNVGFNTAMTGGNSTDPFETIENWANLLAKVMNDKNGRADKIIDYNNAAKKTVADKIDSLKDSDKPKVMIIFAINANGTVKVAGSGHYSEYWLSKTGGINVAKDLNGLQDVGMETIYDWNPDYIFFANSAGKMPSDIINNTISGQDWSTVNAAKTKQVYMFPSATYFSYAPSLEAGVTLQFLAKVLHPELFEDLDIEKVASNWLKEMFGYDASKSDVEAFLYPDPISVKIH